MLSLRELCAGYGRAEILREVNADFRQKEITAIIGPNGSGKTTLIKTLAGLIRPSRGTISLDGRNLKELSPSQRAREIAYLPQMPEISAASQVFEAVLLGRKPYIVFSVSEKDLEVVERVLSLLNLQKLAFRQVTELSGGERQKVMLARALAQEPRVLLLDEPTNHLDPKNQLELLTLLQKLTEDQNLICILVAHDLNLALRFARRFVLMKNGKIFGQGEKEVISSQILQEIFEVGFEIIEYQDRTLVL
ncbi:MAG: ABC transporter ATP-binding protein [Candidatus Saccharicenans sp.]|nr:ABC transporter ATP-binding protein [Candidatus Saccharicenans sp.]MDI6849324.1 ABC transporter ATP-binding protein [Candidatus Saccharicenans sp.]